LLSDQFNGVAKPAGWKSRDGRLWFTSIRGVVAVDCRIKTNDKQPPVFIEEVLADRTPVLSAKPRVEDRGSVASPLEIRPGRGELEFHCTALSLQAPGKIRFKYMLEGVDSGWTEAVSERVAHYNSVPSGRYRFRVIACNNDGVWNEQGATLSLVLLPHLWQTWWFRAAIAAIVGLLLTVLYRARMARLRSIERLRVQIAANLHDDIGARLTKMAMLTEFADREAAQSGPGKRHLQTLSQTVREIIQAMDEIVWTINPKNDTLDNLANYIFHYAQEYFQNTGVNCRLDLPAQLPDWPMSTEARHNLFMAVKEALNNVLKHAQATEVRIGLEAANGRMTITIVDNGRGFIIEPTRSKGNGLENMKRRLSQIGGRFVLESQVGQGTRISMETEGG
jgi:signal transduction histidine kinase